MNGGSYIPIRWFLTLLQFVYTYISWLLGELTRCAYLLIYKLREFTKCQNCGNKQHCHLGNVLYIRALSSFRKHLCKHSCLNAISMRTSVLPKWIVKKRIEEFLLGGPEATLKCQRISWAYLYKYSILSWNWCLETFVCFTWFMFLGNENIYELINY